MLCKWNHARRSLHQDFGFNNQFYPDSAPGSEWDFSNPKVDPATWITVAANADVLNSDGSIGDRLATAKLNDAAKESKRRGARKVFAMRGGT
jgi:hypothetical protein